jgi:hypothetical protein
MITLLMLVVHHSAASLIDSPCCGLRSPSADLSPVVVHVQLQGLLERAAWRYTHVTVVAMGPSSTLKQLSAWTDHVAAAGRKSGIVLEMCVCRNLSFAKHGRPN